MATAIDEQISPIIPPLEESLATNLATDPGLNYDFPLPDLSPSPSPPLAGAEAIRSVLRARLEPILTSPDEMKPIRKKKRRKVLKQSPSVHIKSALDTTISRPLPPLDTDEISEGLTHLPTDTNAPFHHFPVLTHPYEPVQLISQEDICTESSLIGNPITSHPQQGQLLMRSERAFVERKDGRFVPLSNDIKTQSSTVPHSWSIIGGVSRVTLAHVCNAVFNSLGLMASSLLAGVSAWHSILIFTLASYTNLDLNLVANLSKLSLPSHSLFCFLSSITVVYLADRVDIVRLDKQFIGEILKLRRISTLFSIFALFLTSISLIITLSIMFLDLQIHYFSLPEANGWRFLWTDLIANSSVPPTNCPTALYTHNSEYFSPISSQPISERVTSVKSLVLIRAVLNLCGWVMVISSPTQNRWHSHLKELLAEESNSA